jgi:hypothetical protein
MDIKPGDVVRLRKKHPCGSDEWKVINIGVDIRIKCLGCQRLILLERSILERKIKAPISRGSPASKPDEATNSK